MVVPEGLTVGFEVVELKPEGELLQEYVSPVTDDAPIESDPPEQMAVLGKTLAAGAGLTVILTLLVSPQPLAVVSMR